MRDLRTYFHVMDGTVKAVDGVCFSIGRGQTLGVVGESGCGKTVTALSIMRLLDIPPAQIASGEILFEGRDLLKLPEDEMRKLRGNEIAMIFQEPMSSLNPVFTVGDQISEAVSQHLQCLEEGGGRPRHRGAPPGRHRVPGAARQSSTRTSCRAACASAS